MGVEALAGYIHNTTTKPAEASTPAMNHSEIE